MIHFKDKAGNVFAFETHEDMEQYGPGELTLMNEAELAEFFESIKPKPVFPVFVGNAKLDLFTPEEQVAVVAATMTDPLVKLMYDRMIGSVYMTYEDPETEQGLSLLVSKGLLTEQRKVEIVAAMQPK